MDEMEVWASVCSVYERINILCRALDHFSPNMYNDDVLVVSMTEVEFIHGN